MSADLEARLRAACVGRPAKIPWPHRLLHEAAAELARLREDAERLDWLEQAVWEDQNQCYMLVNDWRTIDGKRHPTGLRAAIDWMRKESDNG